MTITFAAEGCTVAHAGYREAVDLSPKQARLIACLARAMPNPIDRKFIAAKVWAGQRIPEAADTILSQHIAPIVDPLACIGLTIKTIRGVGISLQKMEGE